MEPVFYIVISITILAIFIAVFAGKSSSDDEEEVEKIVIIEEEPIILDGEDMVDETPTESQPVLPAEPEPVAESSPEPNEMPYIPEFETEPEQSEDVPPALSPAPDEDK